MCTKQRQHFFKVKFGSFDCEDTSFVTIVICFRSGGCLLGIGVKNEVDMLPSI